MFKTKSCCKLVKRTTIHADYYFRQSWDDASGYGQWVYWASKQQTVNNQSGENNEKLGWNKETNKQKA